MRNNRMLRAIGLAAMTLLAAACTPAEMARVIFPETYEVASTMSVVVDGRMVTQTLGHHCSLGVHQITRTEEEGENHWFRRRDGSILVVGADSTCVWGDAPASGTVVDRLAFDQRNRRRLTDNPSFLFDSWANPRRVDVLVTNQLIGSSERLPIAQARLERRDIGVSRTIGEGFPGLRNFPEGGRHAATPGLGAPLQIGMFVGVSARVYRLVGGTRCGSPGARGPILLPERHPCRFLNECTQSAPGLLCGYLVGGLRVVPENRFARMRVRPGRPDPRFTVTLYHSGLPELARAPSIPWLDYRKWTPEICVESVCLTQRNPFLPALFYYPGQDLLIEVGVQSGRFASGMFG